MKLPLSAQLELDTLLANLSPTSQLPYLGPHIKITKPRPCPSVANKRTSGLMGHTVQEIITELRAPQE